MIKDPDNDGFNLKVEMGKASVFTTFSWPNFIINPIASQFVGTYPVFLTLTDDNPIPL